MTRTENLPMTEQENVGTSETASEPCAPNVRLTGVSVDSVVQITRGRSLAAQYLDRCTHFTGLMGPGMVRHERCAAGVAYGDVTVLHPPIAYQRDGGSVYHSQLSRPCHQSMNLGGAVCEKQCFPTPEEAATHEAETKRETEVMLTAWKRINDATKGARGVSGSIECPKCSQPLHFSVAGSNGHVHARCSTAGCLAWMQ